MAVYVYPPLTVSTTGLATEATLAAIKAVLDAQFDVALSSRVADTTVQATNTKLDTLNATDFATEATLSKLKEWPYATFDAQVYTPAALTNTWQYKTGGAGGTVVGTIVISFTDATKSVITNVTYSPATVV